MLPYAVTKAAALALARQVARDFARDRIRVNALCPGWVDTPFNAAFWEHQDDPQAALDALTASIPLRRQAVPDDIVGLILFLASPASDYITGQNLVIDGGYTAV